VSKDDSPVSVRSIVEELVYRSCLLLDDKDFEGYLGLCHPDFRYTIRAHSPEIRRDMVWMDLDKPGLETLFRNLPRHNSDHAPLTRHATVYTVALDDEKDEAKDEAKDDEKSQATVVSALQVFRTAPDGGKTELFAVGKIHDTVRVAVATGRATLLTRTIRLDTRLLGIGSHIPF
jgi:methanesulfonate monooxygenase small subunit